MTNLARVPREMEIFLDIANNMAEGKFSEAAFWRLQVAARDAILSVDSSSQALPQETMRQMCEITMYLMGGSAASIILFSEEGWKAEAATGVEAEKVLHSIIIPDEMTISGQVIKKGTHYFFANIDEIDGVKKNLNPARYPNNIFCSFPLKNLDGSIMGVISVAGMTRAHPIFEAQRGSIEGVLFAVAAKIAKLRKNAQVRQLESVYDKQREMLENLTSDLEHFRQMETEKERLLYMTIHDFKNPLSLAMLNLAQLKQMPLNEEAVELVNMSEFGCQRLLDMVKSVLDTYKMGKGNFELRPVGFDLAKSVREILRAFEVAAKPDKIRLVYEGPDSAEILVDKGIVCRIITNLLDNAMRHSPMGGTIIVSLFLEEDRMVLSVKDEGEGVPMEETEKIFGELAQGKSAASRKEGTYGLGLPFCRAAANVLGGEIHLAKGDKAGAEFIVTIPLRGAAH